MAASFPSPYDVATPPGAEGWAALYPYYVTFQQNLRKEEEKKFWYCDSQHFPTVVKPFESIAVEFPYKAVSQFNSRHYIVPPANGLDYRIFNGYVYITAIAVAPEQIPARIPRFLERAGYYFQNWQKLLEVWDKKIRSAIAELDSLTFEPLPDETPLEWIRDGRGVDHTTELLENYDRAIQLCYRAWQYHFEFLNLGYAAYLDFFGFCKEQFPSIPDQAIARMVQGIEVDLFRPDDELKKLARRAVELGIADALTKGSADKVLAAVARLPKGQSWLAEWKAAQEPWFNFTSGNGFYSADKYWIDHLELPLGYVCDYVERVKRGEKIERPIGELATERDRITSEYAALLSVELRSVFEQKLSLARTVFPYVENHNFYVEHWFMGVFWRKMRSLSALLMKAGFWKRPDGMFYLHREEVRGALFDYCNAWAVVTPAVGVSYWPSEVDRRQKILEALATCPPEPALNEPPATISEPFTIMLFGITTDRISAWLKGTGDTNQLSGMAASPGQVEGIARVIRSAEELDLVQQDEILVAPVTAPSWAPVFGKIRATVTDIGGMMSHAAIVCREYGLPAVTATGSASTTIKTGQRLRVDGSKGEVTILT